MIEPKPDIDAIKEAYETINEWGIDSEKYWDKTSAPAYGRTG